MRIAKQAAVVTLITGIAIAGCKKTEDEQPQNIKNPEYAIPETYSFTDANGNNTVDYTGQLQRLEMLSELVVYMKMANTQGTVLNAQVMKDMFSNNNYTWQDDQGLGLNTTSKQLRDKCFALHRDQFESWMEELALASMSDVDGVNGTPGVVVSTANPSRQYLLDGNGRELGQIIEKGLMGAVAYYQATSYYLSEQQIGNAVNNTDPVDPENGKYYTTMEHHWDEAFGYFGVPTDFPASTTDRFWDEYCNGRDALLGTNSRLMNAFLTGRAAIAQGDLAKKDAQVDLIRAAWQDVCAGTAIHYLNVAKANIGDDALRSHALSEAFGFTWSLLYNEGGDFTPEHVNTALGFYGDNFYEISVSDINDAIDFISEIAGLYAVKDEL